jgi:hypothetical protein
MVLDTVVLPKEKEKEYSAKMSGLNYSKFVAN